MSRRDLFRLGGAAAGGLALSGCAIPGLAKTVTPAQTRAEAARFWPKQKPTRQLSFANWASYIDPNHQSLKEFTKATGIAVSYSEVIEDDNSFYAKIDPIIRSGQATGYDIMVITDGFEFVDLVELQEVVPLDHAMLPTFSKNAIPSFKRSTFDPGNLYSVPWQSGMTGIAWNTKYVKEPITGLDALWDPKYKGKIGMMQDPQELANFGLFRLGIDPDHATEADWRKAANVLSAQRNAGFVRQYYDQSYLNALSQGDVWITMAWSGDIFQQNQSTGNNDLQFVVPAEGGTIWTDNMMIPKGAQNPVSAMKLMDWYYRPDIAAIVTENVQYIPACAPVRAVIEQDAKRKKGANGQTQATLKSLSSSPLIFPPQAELRRTRNYITPKDPKTAQTFKNIFNAITEV
ncbi:MAG: spermidine/putrescine ABC transporter substrate-binding protein [Streptosporangiales bacterium]|jgi:spermidine/putrescine transport system substrate-binding protein|nr:spermidine/putrescine ABC transporter substrate-binding protein [Streptosporangiales bacterium]